MEYNAEQLEQVEKLASIYMKPTDIALIIEVEPEQFRSDIHNESSEVSRRYRRGKALSQIQLKTQEMTLAKVGSPQALENAHRNLMEMEDDE